jgi:urease subunit gamma
MMFIKGHHTEEHKSRARRDLPTKYFPIRNQVEHRMTLAEPARQHLNLTAFSPAARPREDSLQLTPREFDKLLVYMMADVALKRRAKGLKLNYPEAVAVISAVALDGARAGKTIEDVTKEARTALTKADVMDGVADLIPMVQIEAVFTDGSRLVTVHTPIQ